MSTDLSASLQPMEERLRAESQEVRLDAGSGPLYLPFGLSTRGAEKA